MTNFSFGTFLVDSSNRQAFETAQAVADLRLPDAAPILLLGDSGCGKTHLLRAIVGRVRAATRHVGLAFITARHFPDAARLLIDDPSPVQRAAGAILLVDQLEEFTGLVDELEVVTRIFLDNGHAVIFASHLHPGRLQNITPGLKEILDSARVVSIQPQSSETRVELLKRQFREESGDVIRRQSLEIEELRRALDRLQQGDGGSDQGGAREQLELERSHSRELDRRIEGLEGENARLQEELLRMRAVEGQAQDASRLEEELRALQDRLSALELERADLREQAAQAESMEREIRTLQDQLREAWAKSVHAADLEDTAARLQRELEEAAAAVSERDNLREALVQSESEATHAREEANTLLARAESLLELVESNRARFREVEEQRSGQIAELQAQLEREREQAVPMEDLLAVKRQAEAALSQLGVERESFEETQRALEKSCAEALAKSREASEELADLRETRDRLEGELAAAREVRDAALRDLDEIRPVNAHLKEENSALRAELLDLNSRREETQQSLYDMEAARDEALAELEEVRAEHAGLQGLFSAKARELGSLAAALNAMAAASQADDGADNLPHPEIGGDPGVLPDAVLQEEAGEIEDGFPEPNAQEHEAEHEAEQAVEPHVAALAPFEETNSETDADTDADTDPDLDMDMGLNMLVNAESDSDASPEASGSEVETPPADHGNGSGWHAPPLTDGDAPDDTADAPAPGRVADSLEPLQDLTPLDDEHDSSI